MLKSIYDTFNLSAELIRYKFEAFLFFLILLSICPFSNFSYASDFPSNDYHLTYEKNRISISASNADLKSILTDIAQKASISIQYPESLDKKITIQLNKISLKRALRRLLKDFNYSIVYTGTKKHSSISEVHILDTKKAASTSTTNRNNDTRITTRIKSYERRIESMKKSLSSVDENSARGKRYLRQIESYEKNIERLKKQLD